MIVVVRIAIATAIARIVRIVSEAILTRNRRQIYLKMPVDYFRSKANRGIS